jgi:hypothetical protein
MQATAAGDFFGGVPNSEKARDFFMEELSLSDSDLSDSDLIRNLDVRSV